MTLLLDHNASPAQFSSATYSSAAQRSGVPCLALRFAVLCRAALCVLLNIQQQLLVVVVVPGMIQIPGLCTCFVLLVVLMNMTVMIHHISWSSIR